MGYYINQVGSNFCIKAKNIQPAFKALKGHFIETGDASWINANEVINAKTFQEAMEACRWDVNSKVDICEIQFNGEKLGDEETILNVIAPYVEAGSYIEMSGEEDSRWRWSFDGQRVTEVDAEIDYEGNRVIVEAILKHKKILLTLLGIHPGLDARIHEALSKGKRK
jgi:hypothetical protein